MMSENVLKKQVDEILSKHKTGVLSSVENNKPHSRYMTFYHNDFTLFTPTKADTEKIGEIESNPNVSVLIGFEEKGLNDAYLQITGTSTINHSQQLRNKYWDESFTKWFDGPDDPNFVFLQIKPETIRILNNDGEPSQELQM